MQSICVALRVLEEVIILGDSQYGVMNWKGGGELMWKVTGGDITTGCTWVGEVTLGKVILRAMS